MMYTQEEFLSAAATHLGVADLKAAIEEVRRIQEEDVSEKDSDIPKEPKLKSVAKSIDLAGRESEEDVDEVEKDDGLLDEPKAEAVEDSEHLEKAETDEEVI
jgi:hypothetical protein